MDKLPEGWKITNIDHVCIKITDGTHKTPSYLETGIPFLSVKDITNGKLNFNQTRLISTEEHNQLIKRCRPEKDDILYTKVGTTGIARIIDTDNEFSIFVSLALLKPNKELINSKFFEYLLNSPFVYKQAQAKTRGVANRNLVLTDIKSILIPLPPLEIQPNIVSKLDALFARIDKCIALLEENIKHTQALMASVLEEVFGGFKNDLNKPLLEICPINSKTVIPQKGIIYSYIGLENIESNSGRLVDYSPTSGELILSSKVKFEEGDILYGKLRPYLNKVLVAPFDGIATTEILILKPNRKKVLPEFVSYYLRSSSFVNLVNSNTSGARMPRATTSFFKNTAKVPLPSLQQQQFTIKKLNLLFDNSNSLLTEQQSKLQYLKALKASLLDRAFKGEL